ncbi:hypothetical protein [Hallella sp.]|uniref:hypothetical protein n=1 Tax=Hallella sp. TaxID=2980186 RepID=UPI0030808E78
MAIYTFVFKEDNVGRKYAILSKVMQMLGVQRFAIYGCSLLAPRLHYPLPLGMYRTSKDGLSWCDSWPFEARKMPDRNAKDAFRQADVSFLSLRWRKNGDFARWFGQNLDTTF